MTVYQLLLTVGTGAVTAHPEHVALWSIETDGASPILDQFGVLILEGGNLVLEGGVLVIESGVNVIERSDIVD